MHLGGPPPPPPPHPHLPRPRDQENVRYRYKPGKWILNNGGKELKMHVRVA